VKGDFLRPSILLFTKRREGGGQKQRDHGGKVQGLRRAGCLVRGSRFGTYQRGRAPENAGTY